jgi:hypothetical protein
MMLTAMAAADELTRAVQEQLRAQGAYSGPVDGKPSEDLTKALKDFQGRHNLPASGVLDRATAKALDDENGLALPEPSTNPLQKKTPVPLPSRPPVPVVRPSASALPQPTSPPPIPSQSPTALAVTPSPTANESPSTVEEKSPPEVSPSSPAEGPPQFTVERVTKFLRNFLDAREGKSVTSQLRFYSFPVNYFGYGKVKSQFVRNDILRNMRRWPRRSYKLADDVTVTQQSAETATAEFTASYTLQRGKQRASGRKSYSATLREIKDTLRIVAIKERRG